MTSKTFVKITNRDIYDKLETIEKHVNKINGKVLWHTWAIGVIIVIIVGMIKALI